VVIANEVEAESFDLSTLEHCVVTMGAGGAVHYAARPRSRRAGALNIEPVDTVVPATSSVPSTPLCGARGSAAQDALSYAVTAGSLATMALGAQAPFRRTKR